jgi:3-demethoxyubiquinol 3-hydroxylase
MHENCPKDPPPFAEIWDAMNEIHLDTLLTTLDKALKAVLVTPVAARPTPHAQTPVPGTAPAEVSPAEMSPEDQREAANLMRVNHAGEVAAQGLYHGQALFAGKPEIRALLDQAAREEADHLAWCAERLQQLGSRPSLLSPLWYAGSFAIGAAAALGGDKLSLGFVSETEKQVEGHIDSHLKRLPESDRQSRAILETMRSDEIAHGAAARAAGGTALPAPLQTLMRATAKVMTETSYRL